MMNAKQFFDLLKKNLFILTLKQIRHHDFFSNITKLIDYLVEIEPVNAQRTPSHTPKIVCALNSTLFQNTHLT